MTAKNTIGTSPSSAPSNAVTPTTGATAPGAPTGVTATAGNGQATVAFTVPGSDGGSTITGYTVTSTPGNLHVGGTASPITVTGLTNGQSYTFTVTATNAIGTSQPSAVSSAVTPAFVPVAPGAPTVVAATAGNGYAVVTFTPPASDGGTAITGYTVTASSGEPDGTRVGQRHRRGRTDERRELHVHGHGDERRRHQSLVGRICAGHPVATAATGAAEPPCCGVPSGSSDRSSRRVAAAAAGALTHTAPGRSRRRTGGRAFWRFAIRASRVSRHQRCLKGGQDLEGRGRGLTALFDALPSGVFVLRVEDADRPESLRIVFANAASERVLGVDRSALTGTLLVEAFPNTAEAEIYWRVAVEQRSHDLGVVSYGDERVADHRFAVTAHPLTLDEVVVVFENLSAPPTRGTELAAIVESAEDAILSKDLEGTILTWNDAATRLYGYSAAEAVGQNISMLLPDDRPHEIERSSCASGRASAEPVRDPAPVQGRLARRGVAGGLPAARRPGHGRRCRHDRA